jgi:hypothetical protein
MSDCQDLDQPSLNNGLELFSPGADPALSMDNSTPRRDTDYPDNPMLSPMARRLIKDGNWLSLTPHNDGFGDAPIDALLRKQLEALLAQGGKPCPDDQIGQMYG